ncbi:molybdopterin molybdotransferase MoeA [Henriciella litoralis]|uniref:molybdopterin molybdotransferase MoeA n=1 Tax=Henriciella litoralis TaxID=568102 RepID=UPI0009FF924B|nr:molybdopterin molybdotransferase MoeA [Henriciella litoralis]
MTGMISVEEAFAQLKAHAPGLKVDTVALEAAHGRILAEDVSAAASRPPTDMSAMDGYAVRLSDVKSPGAELNVIGESPAGNPFTGKLDQGEAVRIFTGGEIPAGADHIVIQEDADRTGDTLICREAYEAPQFIRRAGLDFKQGDRLVEAGSRLGAAELALIAAGNIGTVSVTRRPRVGILANGNELKAPGSTLSRGEIANSNPVALAALIRDWGGEPVDLGTASDTMESIASHIEAATDIDIFLPVGGASVGDHDLMRPAFAAAGFTPVFEKIAVRPGKPTWFSTRGPDVVLGLPGNPASALVCAWLFLKPLVSGTPHRRIKAAVATDIGANGPREHFMRARIEVDGQGQLQAHPVPNQDSSLITPFRTSAALLRRLPNAPALKKGELADILLIGQL